MGFRRLQKEQTKKRFKEKSDFKDEHVRDMKKPNKTFKKYKKISWSDEEELGKA
jgi:hypothetical protein